MSNKVRCIQCYSEFDFESLGYVECCPHCGTQSVPEDPEKDITIKINEHSLRILTIWADNWANQACDKQAQKTLSCIIQRLEEQLPEVPLTLSKEIKELAVELAKSGIETQFTDMNYKTTKFKKEDIN